MIVKRKILSDMKPNENNVPLTGYLYGDEYLRKRNKLIIIGAGGHGKVVADIAIKNQFEVLGFLDDDTSKINNGKYKIIGTVHDMDNISKNIDISMNKIYFFVAIGNNKTRENIAKLLEQKGLNQTILIHPSAVIDETVDIGEGTVVMANAVINAECKVGKGCIVNTSSSIDHDCIIGDFVHISPGVHIAGSVQIGKRTWMGIGSNTINNISICENCIIGASSLVSKNIIEEGTYLGTPCRRLY